MSDKNNAESESGALGAAKGFAVFAVLLLDTWMGAHAESLGVDMGALIFFAVSAGLVSLGFTLYYWGTKAAVRRAKKESEVSE